MDMVVEAVKLASKLHSGTAPLTGEKGGKA
jgi:hypothetical protein